MFAPVRTTPPAGLPISLTDVKAEREIEHSQHDVLITDLIEAAVDLFDGYDGVLGRCLMAQTWEQRFLFLEREIDLPFPDISNVAITYVDVDDAVQTVAAGEYEAMRVAGATRIVFRKDFEWPALSAGAVAPVTIEFTAGYGPAATDVPPALRVALIRQAGVWYDARLGGKEPDTAALDLRVQAMIRPFKWVCV